MPTTAKLKPRAAVRSAKQLQKLAQENELLRNLVVTALKEKGPLPDEVERLKAELAAAKRALETHRCPSPDPEAHPRFTEKYVSLERRASRLWSLYVAAYRLHETLERQQVLLVIEEILNAIVGSEEMAIFERAPSGESLNLLCASGVDRAALAKVAVGAGVIGRCIASGEMIVAGRSAMEDRREYESSLTACIPLKLGERVTGAIAVFRMLPQKPTLEQTDLELFELLSSQAAMALYCTKLHAQAAS